MNKNLIVINHIGTSVVEVINKELQLLAMDIEMATEQKTILAFSSQRAIDKLLKKGIRIDHIHDVILSSVGDYKSIKVLPTHLVGGGDYQRVKEFCESASTQLDIGKVSTTISLVESLMTVESKVEKLASIIHGLIKEKNVYTLFVGHGTQHQSSKYYLRFMEAYGKLENQTGFMTLDDQLDQKILELPDEIVLFPLFTVNGHHIRKDIFEGESSISRQLAQQGKVIYEYKNGLLHYKEVRKLYVDSVMKV